MLALPYMAHAEPPDPHNMSDDSQSQAQRNANLARIRDNQRRSRARRKEYLKELESKYRQCEQMGIEASAEIQAAARRVVEENKRLRQLLRQRGMTDAEISGMSMDMPLPDYPPYATAATGLEAMLEVRKHIASESSSGGGDPLNVRQVAATSLPAHQSQQPQYSAQQGQNHSITTPIGTSNTQFPSRHSSVSGGVLTPSDLQYTTSAAQTFQHPTTTHPTSTTYCGVPYDDMSRWQTGNDPVSHTNNSSSFAATDAFGRIKSELRYDVEDELRSADGRNQEYGVSDSQMFDLMDRFSDGSV